jgi:L-ascorbate metabolism protein UlaG (beta-lactamase superfamily)
VSSTNSKILGATVAAIVLGVMGVGYYLLATFDDPPVNPEWAVEGDATIPDGAVTVRFTGTSTLLFSDGDTDWMVDGWFSRFGPIQVVTGKIGPDLDAIERGLASNEVDRLAVVIPVHSHFDHAMDSPEVAKRTGAILLGSQSSANIARGWGLDESQIQIAVDRKPTRFGLFTITLIETKHFQFPDPEVAERALAHPKIEAPLVPPVGTFDYRLGKPYAIHVTHPRGSFLVQASAGYVPGGLVGYDGGLGSQTPEYREHYWRETVVTSGAKRIIPIHWDSLTARAEGPFMGSVRAEGLLSRGSDKTRALLEEKQARHPELHFSTLPRFDEVVLF